MPALPLPGDAALDDAADALAQRVFETLPAGRSHGREAIAGLPAPLARFLLARLDARVDLDAPAPESAWVDAAQVRDGARAWREAARRAARVPAPAWVGFAEQACWLVVSHLVRPAETLAAVAFEEATTLEIPTALALNSLRAFAPYPYLHEVAARYVERKDLTRVDRAELERLLRRIDRRMIAGFSADEWTDLMGPLVALVGPLSPDGSIPSALLVAFFDAREEPDLAEAVAAEDALTPDALHDRLARALAPATEPGEAPTPASDTLEALAPKPESPDADAPETDRAEETLADPHGDADASAEPVEPGAPPPEDVPMDDSPADDGPMDDVPPILTDADEVHPNPPPNDRQDAEPDPHAEADAEPTADAEPALHTEPLPDAEPSVGASLPAETGGHNPADVWGASVPVSEAPAEPLPEAPEPTDASAWLSEAATLPAESLHDSLADIPPADEPDFPDAGTQEILLEEREGPSTSVIPSLSRDLDASSKATGSDPPRRGSSPALAGARFGQDDGSWDSAHQTVSEPSASEAVETAGDVPSPTGEPRPLWALLVTPTSAARNGAGATTGATSDAEPLWKRFASAPVALPLPPDEPRGAMRAAGPPEAAESPAVRPLPEPPPEPSPEPPPAAFKPPAPPIDVAPSSLPEPPPAPPAEPPAVVSPVAPRAAEASPERLPPPPRTILPRTLLPDRSGRTEEWAVPIPPVAPPRAPLPERRSRPVASPAETAGAPSPEGLYRLETRALSGTPDVERRAWFVSELFSGSEEDYRATLVLLADAPSWASATDILSREMFMKHSVNVYSEPTVAFMAAAEARFRR